jgi:transposase
VKRIRRRKVQRVDLPLGELKAIVDRARASLSPEDHEKLSAAVDTLGMLTLELEAKGASIDRLRNLVFGASTEKTSRVVGGAADGAGKAKGGAKGIGKGKRKGHGRNGAKDYRGATKVKVVHESLAHGDSCPSCTKGRVYQQKEPARLVRVTGMAPLQATVYEKDRLRCGLCGEVFTAPSPEGVGEKKYDETAASMIALLKYGCGLPFNRVEKLEQNLGIPLPAATQWEVVHEAAGALTPVHSELIRQAAQGKVLYNDDTTMKVLGLDRTQVQEAASGSDDERSGVFTTGIVATGDEHKIALFFTGQQHAGENLADVLRHRAEELDAPIQMCDALSRNTSGDLDTIVANCVAHARRRFVDVAGSFPEECRHVLEALAKVYRNDAVARKREMSPEDRLAYHQAESAQIMEDLRQWLDEQVDCRRVEPNSGLGEAIAYMQKHWDKLTLFLRAPGAPIDNNLCERVLKKAILHRKNSLFYKTENGARVGDLFMSLIHTSELCGIDPFDYLVQLQRHSERVANSPGDWMPWSYRSAVSNLDDTG